MLGQANEIITSGTEVPYIHVDANTSEDLVIFKEDIHINSLINLY